MAVRLTTLDHHSDGGSQTTTIEQMKMFLTRIGFNPVLLSPVTSPQTDRRVTPNRVCVTPSKSRRGRVIPSFNFFQSEDVVRHPVVARIVNAYEARKRQIRSAGRAGRRT